jgi:NitT/TauT family transport system permease protein
MSGVGTVRESRVRRIIDPLWFGLLIILVWGAVQASMDLHEVLLPGPLVVAEVLRDYSFILAPAMLDSLSILAIGFSIGVALGILLAMLLHYSPVIREAIYPFLVATFVVPKAVFVPLLLLWFGVNDLYKIIIVVTMTFFPVLENSLAGFRGLPNEMLELSHSLKANALTVLTKVRLPYALPNILAGIKLGLAEAFIGIVLAELLAPSSGIGSLIVNASRSSATSFVMAGIIYIGVTGLAAYFLFDYLEKKATFWKY